VNVEGWEAWSSSNEFRDELQRFSMCELGKRRVFHKNAQNRVHLGVLHILQHGYRVGDGAMPSFGKVCRDLDGNFGTNCNVFCAPGKSRRCRFHRIAEARAEQVAVPNDRRFGATPG
jgi:hypothetical protein